MLRFTFLLFNLWNDYSILNYTMRMKNPKGIKVAQYLCLLPGIFLIVSGSMLLLTIKTAEVLFDLQNLEDPLALGMGIRQLALGTIIVMLTLTRQLKALGLVMIIGAIIPMSDFFYFQSCYWLGICLATSCICSIHFRFGFLSVASTESSSRIIQWDYKNIVKRRGRALKVK